MRIFLLMLLSSSAWAANYTATASGDWSFASTWGNSGPPENGDTATISDGVTVTVSDARTVGTSGPSGTIAINAADSGALIIAAGGLLQVRGDIQYSSGAGANTAIYLTVRAGGIFEWDSSRAASPATTHYAAHPDGFGGYRPFVTAGTPGTHAIVRSNAGGGNGYWRLDGFNVGGAYTFQYTDFLLIGDGNNPAFSLKSPGDHSNHTYWDATHNIFTACGLAPNSALAAGEEVFRHSYNVHAGSLAPAVMFSGGISNNPICTAAGFPAGCQSAGIREMVANVFDERADTQFAPRDATIHSNYFADKLGILSTAPSLYTWWYFQNNFYRIGLDDSGFATLAGDSRDNLWFCDLAITTNPHGPTPGAATSQSMSGEIVDHAGYVTGSISGFYITGGPPSNAYAIRNSILLPNAAGNSSFWIASMLQNAGEHYTLSVDHNTWLIRSGGAGVFTAHGSTTVPNNTGQLTSFRDNILWNPTASNMGYKLSAFLHWNLDVCLPANCDYNDGFNTSPDGGGFTNGGNGYADNFSSTPGQHDMSVTPGFVDATRNTATFDSAYLGNHPMQWVGNAIYNLGEMVSNADPTIYAGASINYRYINSSYQGTNCSSANPQPGAYTSLSRACWEWASLYRIRQGVAQQTLYDDQVIGAHGVDIITLLIQWIRTGFCPTNPALALAGHDGEDIGALPVAFAPPDFPQGALSQYTLGGSITALGNGLAGVTVSVTGSQTVATATDGSGNYVVTGLNTGGTFTVTPSLPGFSFSPPSQTFASLAGNQLANFVATAAGNVVVSGQVTASGLGLVGVTINVTGSQTLSTVTDASGNYSLTLVKNGTYTLAASRPGYVFSAPASFPALTINQSAYFTGIGEAGLEFYPVTPCRLADTRSLAGFSGVFGPPTMAAGAVRTFPVPSSSCGVPSSAVAYSLNVTVVPQGNLGYLSIWPAGQVLPAVSTLNSSGGTILANAAIVAAGSGGAISVYVTDTTDVLLDINGYFAPPLPSGLAFYPVTPCRVADTRGTGNASPFGAPAIGAGAPRSFPVQSSSCGIPATAEAYSLNFTVAPQGYLGYLTIWPTGQAEPGVSTLNSYSGTVVANAAIVPAGSGGAINVYVSNPSNVLFDVNGYFAPPLATGLKFYPVTPCRVVDTRGDGFFGPFGAPTMTGGSVRSFPIPSGSCGIPTTAAAYSLNVTVVPKGYLGYLSIWPTGQPLPAVSTLNSYTGAVVANAAIVQAGSAGAISVYVTDPTDVLFDINGYFAP